MAKKRRIKIGAEAKERDMIPLTDWCHWHRFDLNLARRLARLGKIPYERLRQPPINILTLHVPRSLRVKDVPRKG